MTKVNPITPTMLVSSFLASPEIRYVTSCLVASAKWLAHIWHMLLHFSLGRVVRAIWLLSHLTCAITLPLFVVTSSASSYRFCVAGAIATYTVSFWRHLLILVSGAGDGGNDIPLALLLNSENTLLLMVAWLHLTSAPSALKIFNFALFLYMNLVTYVLHEVLPVNLFTTALIPVLTCVEPALLGTTCFADYIVQVLYYREYYRGDTAILYGLIFSYITFKRLEKSALARASLFSMLSFFRKTLIFLRMPGRVVNAFSVFHIAVQTLIPLEPSRATALTGRTSVKTRATSIFFEPVLIINDL